MRTTLLVAVLLALKRGLRNERRVWLRLITEYHGPEVGNVVTGKRASLEGGIRAEPWKPCGKRAAKHVLTGYKRDLCRSLGSKF
jgi:hypothetical protein